MFESPHGNGCSCWINLQCICPVELLKCASIGSYEKKLRVYIVGRVARMKVFEVMFRVMMDDG